MASYLIINDEQKLRTLNTSVLTIRKWLRQQNQALKHLLDSSNGNLHECDNLFKKLVTEAKKQQEALNVLLNKGQCFLLQHANLVLEVDLENLVFLWNSYVESLRKLKFPPTVRESNETIRVDCKCAGSGDPNKCLNSENTVNLSPTKQTGFADISWSVTAGISEGDTNSESHKEQISVEEKSYSFYNENDSLYASLYDTSSENPVTIAQEDLDTTVPFVSATERALHIYTDEEKESFDSTGSSSLESEGVFPCKFEFNDENHSVSACEQEDSSDDDEGYAFAVDSGVFASFLPACTEKMEVEKSKKALNVVPRDVENNSSHLGSVSIKKGLSNSSSHCDKESCGTTDGDASPDVGSLITFDIPGLKVTEAIGGDLPSDAKRRRMLLDTQPNTSNFSSRSESPLSMESSRSETPTGTLTRAERQNELWRAIGSIDTFLMDKDIVEACKSTACDLSCEDDDFAGAPNVSFAEFLQQYRELTDWLNQVHKVTQREVTSLSEKYLNQSYHEEMLERSPRREFLNSYSHQLLLRYPNMADQISARMTRLNTQWSALEQTIAPKHGRHDADTMLQDLECDLATLRRWLNAIEARLLPLTINADWTDTELEDKLHRHQALQRDIESHNKIVNAVLKLSERLEHDSQTSGGGRERDSFQLVAQNLERRWHGIWLQSLEWQCRLEEAISKRKGSCQSGFDFSRFSLPVLDESLFTNSTHDIRDQSLIELDDDSLLFIGHRDDFEDSTETSTDDEHRSFELSGRPESSASESRIFHFDYVDSEAQTSSDQDSIVNFSYAGRNSVSLADIFAETDSPPRPSAFFKPDSPLGKRPFPDCISGEASPAKKGSQSPTSPNGGLSPVVQGNTLNSFINSRGLYITNKRGPLIDSLYEDSDHAFLKTHRSLFDRSSGDSANISETESKMGDSPPSNNLLTDSPEHLGGYAITSSDGEEDPPMLRSGSKTEAKDIGYSSESQSNDEVEVMHHQIDMEYKFPGKCEVASDSPLGDKVTMPSPAIRTAYYCMTLVDIDSTDKTDNGDTTDSGGERVNKVLSEAFYRKNMFQSDIIKTCHDEDYADLKIYKDSDSLDDSWDVAHFPSPLILGEHFLEKENTHSAAEQLLVEDECNGLTPMHELLEFSESDSAPESKEKKSIRYLIEHAEDLVKPPSPKHSSLSPSKQQQTLTSPSKHTQTESCSTVESSCDASGEDNSEYEGLKGGSTGEGFSTNTDEADETLFNSMINLESATESLKNASMNDVTFPPSNSSQVYYDSARLRKQTGGNPQQRGRKDRPWSVVGLEDVGTTRKSDNFQRIVAASESAIDHLHFHTDTDSPSQFFSFSHFSTFPRDSHSGNAHRAYSSLEHTSASKSAKRKLKYSPTANTTTNASFTNSGPQLEDFIPSEVSISSSNNPTTILSNTKLPYSEFPSGTSPRKNNRTRRLRRRSSLEKKGISAAGSSSTTDSYNSAEAESESETTDEYLTAPLEVATSDVDDVHNVSGSMSENSTWDNYQMLYPTASEDPGEELLPWDPQDDLEFDDDFVLSKQMKSIVTDVMTSDQQRSKLKFTKQGVPCEDSDSDLEDFHHVLDQSELALKLANQSLRKKRKNPLGTGLHPNPAKYDEIIETYKTNKRCLESICQHLKSDDVTEQDVKRVQELMNEWERLYVLASERHSQAKSLGVVVDTMVSAQTLIQEAEKLLPFDRFNSADELSQTIILLEEKQIVLEKKGQQLKQTKKQLKEFCACHPTLCIDKYMQEVTSLHKSSTCIAKKVSEHVKHLENNQAVWLEYLAEQEELDVLLVADRERLHKLLCQQEYGMPITKKDGLKELETLQSNLSLYESKLSTLQSMWALLTKASDHSAQKLLLASLADLRNQLFVVSERCRQIYQDVEDGDNISLNEHTDFGQLAVSAAALHEVLKKPKCGQSQESPLDNDCTASHASTGITRSCASWLRSLPVQVVALMLVTGLVCALDPDILKRLTNFTLTISPELCYVNGPPTM